MKLLPFKTSSAVSLGVELEFQIINPHSFSLVSRAKELLRSIKESPLEVNIKPEVTQSMIEINSSIHTSVKELADELQRLQVFLLTQGKELDISICGGGTHPFQKWSVAKIFPTMRYKKLSRKFRYLSKRSTVFGQHMHVGCASAEDALYLTHALARYVPHFIALCASSPFYLGIDTGFASSRSTVFNAFPLSGVIPYLTNWEEFSTYFYKMKNLGIISTMKDFYWDIRPKPEFGTVEIRVCDTPLTISKAVMISAYLQALSLYLLEERPFQVIPDLYYLYNTNRFEASRYGLEADFINPYTLESIPLKNDIFDTMKQIERYANKLNNMVYLSQLHEEVTTMHNDAVTLRQILKQTGSFAKVVEQQCEIWREGANE